MNQLINASQCTAPRLDNQVILMASCPGENEDGSVDAVAAAYSSLDGEPPSSWRASSLCLHFLMSLRMSLVTMVVNIDELVNTA